MCGYAYDLQSAIFVATKPSLVASLRFIAGFHFEELMGDVGREEMGARWTTDADHPPCSFITIVDPY